MAKTNSSFIKISSLIFGRVVNIRKLNDKQIAAISNRLKLDVSRYNSNEPVHTYFAAIVSAVVDDIKSINTFREKSSKEMASALLEELYHDIILYYPQFDLDVILFKSNGVMPKRPGEEMIEESEYKVTKVKKRGSQPVVGFKDLAEIDAFKKELKSKVIGQDQVIDNLLNYVKLIVAGLETRASFFFIGPTGVGKTYIAKLFGERFSGNFYKVDCGSLGNGHEHNRLLGSPPGYVGSSEKSVLLEMAEKSNKWVFLFDEIEKAHERTYNILLSLLDDGTIQDNRGKTLDFKESIFIFTSNKGVADIKSKTLGFDSRGYTYEESKDAVVDSINKHFSPEFRNRIDEMIHFNSLSKEDIRNIVKIQLDAYPIEKTPQLIDFIVKNAYSIEYGAREINRFIKRTIGLEVANALLNNKTPINSTYYTPSIIDNRVTITDAIDLKKLAEIK